MSGSSERPRVLLILKQVDARRRLSEDLRQAGYEPMIDKAGGLGTAAPQAAIIEDLAVGMRPARMAQRLTKRYQSPIPSLVLSTIKYSDTGLDALRLELGLGTVLCKPYSFTQLHRQLRRFVSPTAPSSANVMAPDEEFCARLGVAMSCSRRVAVERSDGGRSMRLFVHGGKVLAVTANPDSQHHLGDLLLRRGKLTPPRLARARRELEAGDHGGSLIRLLEAGGEVPHRVLRDMVHLQAELRVAEMLSWTKGTTRLLPSERPPAGAGTLKIDLGPWILDGLRKNGPPELFKRICRRFHGAIFTVKKPLRILVADHHEQPGEIKLVQNLARGMRVHDATRAARLPERLLGVWLVYLVHVANAPARFDSKGKTISARNKLRQFKRRHGAKDAAALKAKTAHDLGTARKLVKSGEFDAAERRLSNIQELDPTNAEGRIYLGWVRFKKEKKPNSSNGLAALEMVKQAVDVAPSLSVGHLMLGRIYRAMGERRKARDALYDALDLDPQCAEALELLRLVDRSSSRRRADPRQQPPGPRGSRPDGRKREPAGRGQRPAATAKRPAGRDHKPTGPADPVSSQPLEPMATPANGVSSVDGSYPGAPPSSWQGNPPPPQWVSGPGQPGSYPVPPQYQGYPGSWQAQGPAGMGMPVQTASGIPGPPGSGWVNPETVGVLVLRWRHPRPGEEDRPGGLSAMARTELATTVARARLKVHRFRTDQLVVLVLRQDAFDQHTIRASSLGLRLLAALRQHGGEFVARAAVVQCPMPLPDTTNIVEEAVCSADVLMSGGPDWGLVTDESLFGGFEGLVDMRPVEGSTGMMQVLSCLMEDEPQGQVTGPAVPPQPMSPMNQTGPVQPMSPIPQPGAMAPADSVPAPVALSAPSPGDPLPDPASMARMPAMEANRLAVGPGSVLGIYRIERLIGTGGMGRVFTAVDTSLGRTVAVKLMKPEMMVVPRAMERFKKEARSLAKINSTHVTQIYFLSLDSLSPYLVMEYVDGPSLHDVITERGPFTLTDALDLIIQAVQGLAVVLDKGLIHRDINPKNLLVDPSGTLKITDFGLVKTDVMMHSRSVSYSMVGTPLYMAPEQADGRKTDFRADIYALGMTLFHMVVGRPLFTGATLAELLVKHATHPAPSLGRFVPGVPGRLDRLFMQMVAKSPEERPPSYERMRRKLTKIHRDLVFGKGL